MSKESLKKPSKQMEVLIDYSKVAVGIYSYRYSVENDLADLLEDKLNSAQSSKWDDVEFFIALNFDVSNPFFEEFQLYLIDETTENGIELLPINAKYPSPLRREIEDAICKKIDNHDELREILETEEEAVILLEDLLSKGPQ